jgi:hypothetical protein
MARLGGIVQREYEFGALSTGSHRFYERLGWERWSGPTFVRTGHGLVRTEDDGVMAMRIPRFGSSTGLDLTAPISCEARSGAYW